MLGPPEDGPLLFSASILGFHEQKLGLAQLSDWAGFLKTYQETDKAKADKEIRSGTTCLLVHSNSKGVSLYKPHKPSAHCKRILINEGGWAGYLGV